MAVADREKTTTKGRIAQVVGAVVDVEFDGKLPEIYDALEVYRGEGKDRKLVVLEVQQDVGNGVVRCISMDTTEGLKRGDEVTSTGAPISVPVGEETLGRMFNVTGEDRKSTRLNSSHYSRSRMPSSA